MILVTGGTGLIGGEILRRLSQAGKPVRALARNMKKAQPMPGVTWVDGDLSKPETLPEAFEGARTVSLLTHYLEDMVELQLNAISAARAAGVSHVVKSSAFAASDHSKAPIGRWHYQVEKELEASGMAWTHLRPTISCRTCSPRPNTSATRVPSIPRPETARFPTSTATTWARSPP